MSRDIKGKSVRLRRIFRTNGRTLILPVDDALIFGPTGYLRDPAALFETGDKLGVDAYLGYPGSSRRLPDQSHAGRILNVTASTRHSNHTRKYQVSSVQSAIAEGADAVAVHVNVTCVYEGEMIATLGHITGAARQFGIPVVAIMYPRRATDDGDDNYEALRDANPEQYACLVAHSVRIAVEIGADPVKTQYSGSIDSFRLVTESACGIPVVIAGGPLVERSAIRARVVDALSAGAAGVSIGRNVHQSQEDFAGVISDLVQLIHS